MTRKDQPFHLIYKDCVVSTDQSVIVNDSIILLSNINFHQILIKHSRRRFFQICFFGKETNYPIYNISTFALKIHTNVRYILVQGSSFA